MTGKYKAVPGNADCLNCDAGKYSGVAGVTACQECLAGKFKPEAGSNECRECDKGKYKAAPGINTVCDDCDAGKFAFYRGMTSCWDCPAGKYETNRAQSDCTGECSAGKYLDVTGATSNQCKDCSKGKFSNTTHASSCDACPANEETKMPGSADRADCDCKKGYTRSCETKVCTVSGACYYFGDQHQPHRRRLKSCFWQACGANEISNTDTSKCEQCPEGGKCDGSDQMSCQPGYYKFNSTKPIPECHKCPAVSDIETAMTKPL
jgi:hypothetical protein